MASSETPETSDDGSDPGLFIEAAELLSHVQELEARLPELPDEFGHPEPPKLYMSQLPMKKRGHMALMAATKRCVSAQILRETPTKIEVGSPVEVLVIQGEDQITCATMLSLELPKMSAPDTLIVPDRNQGQSQGSSLMSGGLIPVAPAPRLAIVVGTKYSRVISVEFSVKPKSLQLERRPYYVGKEIHNYFEPLPFATLTSFQRSHRRGVPGKDGKTRRVVPFDASDGVCTMVPFEGVMKGRPVTHVWMSFGDGTGLRVHHAGFFASVVQRHTESQPNPRSLEDMLGGPVIRWEAKVPPLEETHFTVVPVPKYHPSPLAPFPAWKKPEFDEADQANDSGDPKEPDSFEAVIFCSGAMIESFPTLAFYTSEDQFEGRIMGPDPIEEDDEEESSGILSSMIGGIFGLLSGGGSKSKKDEEKDTPTSTKQEWDANVPLPSINLEPYYLYAGSEIHDPPRQITQCTVEPGGDFAALADTLGRVSLVCLASKQIVRMWKGLRDATCHWLEVPKQSEGVPGQKLKTLYLVIHSRQRKMVEVWRTRHGPKVLSFPVPREAQVIGIRELTHVGYVASCYLAHSNVPFSDSNQVERIVVNEDQDAGMTNSERNRPPRPDVTLLPQDAAAKLNWLKQLLSDTNVECQSVDVFRALERIKSVEDLAIALDTLASSPTLERKMGVDGSTFHRLALHYCKQKLDEAIEDAGEEAFSNPHVQQLGFKIAYYTQVSNAYDVIHRHETNSENIPPVTDVVAPTGWGLEALGWTSTYEKIAKKSIDDDIPSDPTEPMKFYEFTAALEPPKKPLEEDFDLENSGYKVYFSDSTKQRREILVRIFRPLLGDVFSFNAVTQIFEALGTLSDPDYLMQCFGEWFCSLSVKLVTKFTILSGDSSVKRWLEESISSQMPTDESSDEETQPLEPIFQFCRQSEELVRAFWLAALCREAINQVAEEKEAETYGKVTRDAMVERWDDLLRQLRICLFVSLRLHGAQLGPLPLTVEGVDNAKEFSIYSWLVLDELKMSQNHDEILSLERACRMSNRGFDASQPEADAPERWKELQNACLSTALSEEERAEYLVEDDDGRLGALLLYLKQFNVEKVLVAHRALQLAARWGRDPGDLETLGDAVVALRAIDIEEHKRISAAVRLDIWQSQIRPVYRALMFGFDDVQEISPEVVAPLYQDVEWVKCFSAITSEVLEMLNEFEWHEHENINLQEDYIEETDVKTWPPAAECPILARLVDKNRKIRISAFEAHQMLMSALKLTQDFPKLSRCIPSFYELFTPGAMFARAVPVEDAEENQQVLMQDSVVAFAKSYNGPCMDTLELGEIEVLSDLFEFEMDIIRTLFILAMYEYGKDRIVDGIITKSAPAISVEHFCDSGVEIVCRRLNHLLHVQPSPDMQTIMGTLSANLCEWIKEKAENSESLVNDPVMNMPPGNTHLFALRLLTLGASGDIEKAERVKMHSLIVLSGTIVKGLEGLAIESDAGHVLESEAHRGAARLYGYEAQEDPTPPLKEGHHRQEDRRGGSYLAGGSGYGLEINLEEEDDAQSYGYGDQEDRGAPMYGQENKLDGSGVRQHNQPTSSDEEEEADLNDAYGYEQQGGRESENTYGYSANDRGDGGQYGTEDSRDKYGYGDEEEGADAPDNYGYGRQDEDPRGSHNYGREGGQEANRHGHDQQVEYARENYGYGEEADEGARDEYGYGEQGGDTREKYGYGEEEEGDATDKYGYGQQEEDRRGNYDYGEEADNKYGYGKQEEDPRQEYDYGEESDKDGHGEDARDKYGYGEEENAADKYGYGRPEEDPREQFGEEDENVNKYGYGSQDGTPGGERGDSEDGDDDSQEYDSGQGGQAEDEDSSVDSGSRGDPRDTYGDGRQNGSTDESYPNDDNIYGSESSQESDDNQRNDGGSHDQGRHDDRAGVQEFPPKGYGYGNRDGRDVGGNSPRQVERDGESTEDGQLAEHLLDQIMDSSYDTDPQVAETYQADTTGSLDASEDSLGFEN